MCRPNNNQSEWYWMRVTSSRTEKHDKRKQRLASKLSEDGY